MKQCKICMNKPYKDKLFCCAVAELHNAFNEIMRNLPLFGQDVKPFECGSRLIDKRYTGFLDESPVYCRHSINYELSKNDDEERKMRE